MTAQPYLRRLALASLLALAGVVGAQNGAQHQQMSMMQMQMGTGDPLAELQGEEFDVGFMSMMIAHHQGAVEMAEWLLERTENPELRAAAEAVIAAQDPEIQQMTTWLEEWYGREIDAMMAQMMQADMDAMMTNMEAGANADIAFLQMMTEHHMSAIDMAQLALVRTQQPELRTLARDIVVTQAEEAYQYQQWLADDSTP